MVRGESLKSGGCFSSCGLVEASLGDFVSNIRGAGVGDC